MGSPRRRESQQPTTRTAPDQVMPRRTEPQPTTSYYANEQVISPQQHQQQPQQQSQSQQQPQQQQVTCDQHVCEPRGGQAAQPVQATQMQGRPRVDCLCAGNRANRGQKNQSPFQAPLADTYTCSRPRAEPSRRVTPVEELCTCKAKSAPPQCECAPPVVQEQPRAPPTHAHITCGQPTQYMRAQYTNQNPRTKQPAMCGHCQSTNKKKKCIIQ
ncbi:GH17789 [Drosophila grimshawi]|uniref:GH17789 n=2 Tax=Drosophila grimshawi TaxID=7222 RepID=B4JSN2_DROGR|nr:GH17789 [Drosophila grimshawi]